MPGLGMAAFLMTVMAIGVAEGFCTGPDLGPSVGRSLPLHAPLRKNTESVDGTDPTPFYALIAAMTFRPYSRRKEMKRRAIYGLMAAAMAYAAIGGAAAAEKAPLDRSRIEYLNLCAVCHGESGKGDGKMADILKVPPSDLTTLAKTNNGVFPYDRLYAVIDGREMVTGHGDREMPVWGKSFIDNMEEASEYYFDGAEEMEMYTRMRILAIIDYLHRIQSAQ